MFYITTLTIKPPKLNPTNQTPNLNPSTLPLLPPNPLLIKNGAKPNNIPSPDSELQHRRLPRNPDLGA